MLEKRPGPCERDSGGPCSRKSCTREDGAPLLLESRSCESHEREAGDRLGKLPGLAGLTATGARLTVRIFIQGFKA